ncbi:hypothetical protein FRB99_005748 [Tulasnella sp. 403]|nr:hypothetical protein FRB99_005748 [Tulasnella sp. 403]
MSTQTTIKIYPEQIPPNTITLLGLCLVLVNFFTLLCYDPFYLTEKDGATGPPRWVYFSWAAGLFFYQAFDAIDGKQARRTGMAGPLGQMFDHGCDALNTTFECVLVARALNVGRSWWTVSSEIAAVANFYLTTWEEFHTGTLYLGVFNGPVDGIILLCIMYIITGLHGTSFWDQKFLAVTRLDRVIAAYAPKLLYHIGNPGLNDVFFVVGAVQVLFNILLSYRNVYRARVAIKKSPFTPLGRFLPFPITVGLHLAWISASGPLSGPPQQAYILHSNLFLPFLMFWAFEFAHQVGKMILAHVTHQKFPYWDWSWVWTGMAALDANSMRLFGREPIFHRTPTSSAIFMGVSILLSFGAYVRFCTLVISDITNYLGIACFTVRKRDPATGQWITSQELEMKQKAP